MYSQDVIFLEGNPHAAENQNETSGSDTEVDTEIEVDIESGLKNDDSHEVQVNAESADVRLLQSSRA